MGEEHAADCGGKLLKIAVELDAHGIHRHRGRAAYRAQNELVRAGVQLVNEDVEKHEEGEGENTAQHLPFRPGQTHPHFHAGQAVPHHKQLHGDGYHGGHSGHSHRLIALHQHNEDAAVGEHGGENGGHLAEYKPLMSGDEG